MKPHIFITGTTGNVGAKLVPETFRQMPEATLTLLVRGGSKSQAEDRAMQTIRKLSPEFDTGGIVPRVNVVCGDITMPRLGLSEADYIALAERTTHIIHAAAATKFRMPEEEARKTNYDGTRHMVAFAQKAMRRHGLHTFAHVGTAYACGDRDGDIAEKPYDTKPEFSNIYERTKWEAEQYLYTCRNDLPINIFRPSIIVGDARTGAINDFNVLYAPLRLILTGRVRILPCRPDIPLDIVSLDYVARVITSIACNPQKRGGEIYHVTAGADNETAVGDVIAMAAACVEKRFPGLSVSRVRYLPAAIAASSVARLMASGSRVASVMHAYLPYFATERHFDNTNMRARMPVSIKSQSFEAYVETLMDYFIDHDLGRHLRRAA
jgi:long-chain acyl-CoA synthetase